MLSNIKNKITKLVFHAYKTEWSDEKKFGHDLVSDVT